MGKTVFRWQAVAGLLAVIVLLFGVLMIRATRDRSDAESQVTALQQSLVRLQNEQLSLKETLSQAGTSSYVETVARTEYAYLKEGELRFEVVNPDSLDAYTEAEMRILIDEMTY